FQPGVISGITFIRMYMLLTVWCMAVVLWHILRFEKELFLTPGAAAGLMVLVFLGFLTHYYFAVFLFFAAAFTCLWLWWGKKQLKTALYYAITVCTGMGLAVLYYPSCLGHIFRGYRGTEAAGAFFDLSNTLLRLDFFTRLMDRSVFGGTLPAAALLLVVLWTAVLYRSRREPEGSNIWRLPGRYPGFFFLLFVTAGYFPVVAKTALLNAEEANRYELPVYGFCMLLTLLLLYYGGYSLFSKENTRIRVFRWGYAVVLLIFLGAQQKSLLEGQVQFLYESDREHVAWAKTQAGEAVVYLYNPVNLWMIWDESEELMQYEEIYFVSLADTSPIEDKALVEAERIYVYTSRLPEAEDIIKQLQEKHPQLQECKKIRELLYCDLYCLGATGP
ncbi:MAG: hypothetical protein IJC59_00005, partial [Lachnospiraceae bacterium]|nr:hypothetical protein [Lachnospiraceae bacterium]